MVIHGSDLRQMTAGDIDDILGRYDNVVFARISALQTSLIAEACQRQQAILAVTDNSVYQSLLITSTDNDTETNADTCFCCYFFI